MRRSDLHNYQEIAVQHILNNSHCALFLDMGLGKTVSSLTAVSELMFSEMSIGTVLVIAPKRVAEYVWDAEINKWEHLKGLRVSKIIGSEKQRKAALKVKADIYLLGRDNVPWFCAQFGGLVQPFDMLIIDELSSFKNPKSLRFKSLRKIASSFGRIVGLTGTPAPNGLLDLWSQIYLLDKGERLDHRLTAYREKYFRPGKRNGDRIFNYDIRKGAKEEIYEKLSDICMSMSAKDYLDLPGRIDNVIKVVLPPNIQKMYNKFEEEQFLSIIEANTDVTAASAAALATKLQQFANGAIYDENREVHEIHDLKIEAVKEIIEDANGQSVLIAWKFKHDRDRLMEALKIYKPRELKEQADIDEWNSGAIRVLMMHPASGGHGLNLQAGGHIVVWFGPTYSLELDQQFNARLDRQGQREVVIVNKIVASSTVDEDIVSSLASKDDCQNNLLKAMRAKMERYLNNYYK